MKFYDNNGNKHNTVLGAMVKNVSIKADNFLRNKMPSYEETINENEHLYDAVEDRYPVYPPEDITVSSEAAPLTEDSAEEPATEDLVVEGTKEETSTPKQEIKIDYAHQCINLVNEKGEVISSSPLDPRLLTGTVDKDVMDVLYPMGQKVPEEIHSNIQSTDVQSHIAKTNSVFHPDIITPDNSDQSDSGPAMG